MPGHIGFLEAHKGSQQQSTRSGNARKGRSWSSGRSGSRWSWRGKALKLPETNGLHSGEVGHCECMAIFFRRLDALPSFLRMLI